jgi:glyoxylase-like metal-dependent hydrolase (beta-lactamase superfamily II)
MRRSIFVGDVEIVPLLDAVLPNPFEEAFPGVSRAAIHESYPGLLAPDGVLNLPVTCFLVRSRGRSILVDTGVGPRRRGTWPRGQLHRRLAEIGMVAGDIDLVVNTHFHADHVGWNTVDDPDGTARPWFERARYLVQAGEWSHWADSEQSQKPGLAHVRECIAPLFDRAEVRLVGPTDAITAEVSFVALPGHTPGHVGVGIVSRSERAIILGDASHHPGQLDHPDWSPLWAARVRARLFDDAERTSTLLAAGHWPFPGIGRVIRVRGHRVFRAARPLVGGQDL